MAKASYVHETQILHRVANNPRCRWWFKPHASKQMLLRGITMPDVKKAVMTGQVTLHEVKQDLLWRVEGTGIDGESVQAIVAVYEDEIVVKVITAF